MYNSALYNQPNYNSTHFTLDAFESMSPTDQNDAMASVLKTDLLAVSDALFKLLENNPFLDDLFAIDDNIANMPIKQLADTSTLIDVLKFLNYKNLSDIVTLTDLRRVAQSRPFVDATILVDFLTKSIVDKKFNDDIIRLKDWFMIKHTAQSDEWYN